MIAQGDERQVGLIVDGHVAVRRTTLDGHEVIPRIVSRGQLGPFLPISRRPSSAETLALSACRVAVWHGDDVYALAAADAGFAMDLLGQVLRAFEEIVDRFDGLHYQNALRRVARILHQHSDVIFGEEVIVTRRLLPALVGTSREMTGRVLRELESDGIVERIGKDRLRLVNAGGLARVAASQPATPDDTGRNKFLARQARPMQE